MLEENGIGFSHRDPAKSPLSPGDLGALLDKMGMRAADLLRTRDKSYRELELTGGEAASYLIELMVEHPGLMNRPIAVKGPRAVLARPPELVLEL